MAKTKSGDFFRSGDPRTREDRVRRGFWPTLRRAAGHIPFAEDAAAAYFCAFDPQTPLRVRMLLMAALAYFVMPFDVVPDFLVGIGFVDDAAVLATALSLLGANLRPEHREAARRVLCGEETV